MKKLVVVTLALAVTAFAMLSAGAWAQELAPTQQEDKNRAGCPAGTGGTASRRATAGHCDL